MTEKSQIVGVMIFVILIVADALLYGFGAAIQAINKNKVDKRAEEVKDKKSILLNQMIDEPTNLINTIQIIINLISIFIGFYQVRFFNIPILDTCLVIYLLLTFGILIPKKFGQKYCDSWSYKLVKVVRVLVILFTPITFIITLSTNIVCRIFGVDPNEVDDDVTEELMSMLNEVHEQGVLLASEAAMINNIFEFGDKDAKDIMIHRKNIVAINGDFTLSEVLKYILKQNYSRFPVFEGDIDNVIGIVNLKDLFIAYNANIGLRNKQIKSIKGLLRKALFIPETRSINILFQSMQFQKVHMVIIADEYGQTAGVIAMEDILEEIVGNILDEYDKEDIMVLKQADGSFIIDGMAPLEELEDILEIKFETEDCEILNGFLITLLDKIPTEGEVLIVEYAGYIFDVIKVEDKMIKSVKVDKKTV
ncbi:MAG: hemolysin family protein [Lachnotalea sp.]